MRYLLAQQVPSQIASPILQYGAIGVLALVGLIAVVLLWKRVDKLYDAEHERADRLETELLNLNRLINTELSGHLVRATEAMREVTSMLRYGNGNRGGK